MIIRERTVLSVLNGPSASVLLLSLPLWVGLTLISVFHHLAQLPSRFCQSPISPSRVGQTVEHSKSKSTKPSLSSLGTPCISVPNHQPATSRLGNETCHFLREGFLQEQDLGGRQSVNATTFSSSAMPSCQEMRVSGVRPFLTIPHILLYTTI